ncbi:MAG: hypothetical protein PHY80_02510 [Rickettsiales bacterium]|nr:hypothetical protein [Rickettsiales bacterium]
MSTSGSFITTPVKSSIYKTSESISPKKNGSKVFKSIIMSNSSYKQKIEQKESAESSLIIKLIENQISS